MKKMLKVVKMPVSQNASPKACILAYRTKDDIQFVNLERNDSIKLEKTPTELVIRIPMNDSDFLVLDEDKGIAEKFVL